MPAVYYPRGYGYPRFRSSYTGRRGRRYFRRRFYRRGYGAGFAQRNGRRQFTLSVPVENINSVTIAANSGLSNLLRTCPYRTRVGSSDTEDNRRIVAQSLFESAAYRLYTKLYDQVKINYVVHRVGIAANVGDANIPALKVYTAWDRHLGPDEAVPSVDDMLNGPESTSQMFVNNSRAEFTRYCRASDLSERTTFHNCLYEFSANNYYRDQEWATGSPIGFSPSMFLCVQASNTTASSRVVPINISSTYSVTFRNPRFGLSAQGAALAKSLGESEVEIPEKSEVKESDLMDDESSQVLPDASEGKG